MPAPINPLNTTSATTSATEANIRLHHDSLPLDPKDAFQREFALQQARYADLRYKLSATLLVACPILALLPPRKLDWYTFGLGGAWIYALSEVSASHGRDMMRGFRRREDVAKSLAGLPEVEGVKVRGWLGEKIVREYRKKEEEADDYGSLILQQIWDVWEQRDKKKARGENDDEATGFKEELRKIRQERERNGEGEK